MAHVEEIPETNDHTLSSFKVLETGQLPPKTKVRAAELVRSQRPHELNVSGSQLLVGFTSAFGGVSLPLWALLKLWLFE